MSHSADRAQDSCTENGWSGHDCMHGPSLNMQCKDCNWHCYDHWRHRCWRNNSKKSAH